MKKIHFVFLVFTFLFACSKEIEKVIAEKYPDGNPKVVKYYKKDGKQKKFIKEIAYYPNHQMRYEGEFVDGEKHGKWVYYYDNGKKWSEGVFLNGMREGLAMTWYENGQLYIKGEYDTGTRTGTWYFYDEDGSLLKKISYD